jgi:excisionase family DNA binding protein
LRQIGGVLMITTLKPGTAVQRDLALTLHTATEQLPATSPVLDTLRYLTSALDRGADVTLLAHDQELTPNQAARVIGISRPHLLTFMDSGALPFTRVGTHRRIKASDLLEFHERRQAAHQRLANSRADAPTAERRHLDETAPLSDTALADLDPR